MKKLLICLSILLAPLVAGAAYNDVTLTTDTVINVGGIDLDVTGSSAVVQSITVNTSSFSFVLLDNATIQVTSADRRLLGSSSDGSVVYVTAEECDSSQNMIKFGPVSGAANTITVTPSANTCTVPASASPLGGSSSRNRSITTLAVIPTPTPTVTPGQATFTRNLSVGSTGAEVTALQQLLVSEGHLVMPTGVAYGYYGSLTVVAVKAYQAKYGIDQVGVVGPITRAQLNKDSVAAPVVDTTSSQATPAEISTMMSQINALLQQVQELQAQLETTNN